MNESVKVDVWSDIACPWCYIGKRKFEAGVAAFSSTPEAQPVEVEYHSFELSPDTPVDFEGTEAEFLSQHKGLPVDRAQQMIDQVAGIAESVGLHYDYDALRHTNTVKAHQVIHLAKQHGKQLEMVERLFTAYFERGEHVGQDESLADLGASIGLDRDEVLATLRDDAQLAAVRADQAQAQAFGINGVPFFVIDGKYGVSGAQDPAAFEQVLRQVVALRDTTPEELAAQQQRAADDAAADAEVTR
ncbi:MULTISPECIES: DsbA family protein [Curtobacterium]|uniref:DSBA oxidoreductase n=1 Tax=Curtobacterium oceanosedimentum TaxID=465820 RepID=A0ABR5S7T1_9MICO|nr:MULTISPECIES: DsbA family oxidoreductase [Curtobacterium]KTR39050.1 DSBA oxidoreductase [Curtobacterium oceanosedimentum]QCR43264.1 DsbA family oxidoreductase [Curtobacterium sp. SGAir0471]UBQ03839.1 DsbA family oxidoreductase [Curtobacterium sp. TXMA1]